MTLTETEARERLGRLCAADHDPTLDTTDLNDCLTQAKRSDPMGRLPDEDGYEATWDMRYAASLGWELKAARAAGGFRFEEDTQVFYREQVFNHCEEMAKRYRRGASLVALVNTEV